VAYIVTENIPLNMPVPGTREPAQIALLNENCVTLSNHDHTDGKALAVGRLRAGLEANRPAAGSAGNVYFATDTGRFYVDTGTAWVQFLTEGGQGTVTGWTLVDPIIRDTLQFGPEGSGTIDATITRTGQGALTIPGTLTLNADAGEPGLIVSKPSTAALTGAHPDWPYMHFGSNSLIRGQGAPGVGTLVMSINSIFKADSKGYAVVDGAATQVVIGGSGLYVYTAPTASAGGEQVMTARFSMDAAGGVLLNPAVASNALQVAWPDASFYIARGSSTATNTRLYSSHSMEIDPANNYFTPARDGVVALGAPNFRWGAAHVTGLYTSAPTNNNLITLNTMFDVIPDASGHLRWRRLPSGTTMFRTIYSLPGLFMDEEIKPASHLTISCGVPAAAWSNVVTGQVQGVSGLGLIASPGGAISLSSSTTSCIIGAVGYVHPAGDANQYFGHPSYRWYTGYFYSAPVIGSAADIKEDFAPLDPVACAEAVRGTDWLAYAYKAPVFSPPALLPEPAPVTEEERDEQIASGLAPGRTAAERDAVLRQAAEAAQASHATAVAETAIHRRQKGYALGHETYRVHDLFGLSDRKNRSDGADLAVVACALQHALERIAALEAASGQAPAA
jgi:hypothetical protein